MKTCKWISLSLSLFLSKATKKKSPYPPLSPQATVCHAKEEENKSQTQFLPPSSLFRSSYTIQTTRVHVYPQNYSILTPFYVSPIYNLSSLTICSAIALYCQVSPPTLLNCTPCKLTIGTLTIKISNLISPSSMPLLPPPLLSSLL